MGDADGGTTGPAGRWVSVRLQHRHVRVDDQECPPECAPGRDAGESGETGELSMSYPGIVICSYDEGRLVGERWIPLGAEPSEEDDEVLIEQLRAAMLWQAGRPPQETPGES
ncbi:hypothetical protein [Amycolatopsis saalfeldensis]|uniref:Uncharacterized protein n=1 Tax=Amycolatopsis saalfeldensis TaxID=394193 RepID=A0A1H8YE17_9PSEU|nr:hypothetical protein [Amycolatopsis saalfeldensis]SEP50322.1 hypothetical protein SAMN04489732_11495 [Amycolatopsis saalfeldensis]